MRIEAAKQAAPGQSGDFAGSLGRAVERKVARDGAELASECRALVVIEAAAAVPPAPVYREAAFLAHLIATREHVPQTRERRRAEPGEAISAYRAAMAMA